MDRDAAMTGAGDASIPSCESCRRRKLRCGRQQPSCTNCGNFEVDCIYNFEKKKPGLKVGAVENLSRRLEVVEAALARRDASSISGEHLGHRRSNVADGERRPPDSYHVVLSSLIRELHSLTNAVNAAQSHRDEASDSSRPPCKRRQPQSDEPASIDPHDEVNSTSVVSPTDPRWDERVVDTYLCCIQPWLSILHDPSFRKQFQERQLSKPTKIVFQAMLVATLPHVDLNTAWGIAAPRHVKEARHLVMSTALDTTCIEHIQALLILTYAEIIDGNVRRAMSLLGTITTQLEMLGIDRERSDGKDNRATYLLFRTATFDWIGDEEERRVVWNARILSRLCSVLVGRGDSRRVPSSTRRLPACASFWYTNRQTATPFLQCYGSLDEGDVETHGRLPANVPACADSQPDETAWKGSLAFFIETVEFMGAVLSHLRRTVIYRDRSDVSRWLKTFRDLDEHLMR